MHRSPPVAEAATTIDAPIEIIWQVMLDVDAYPAWNPFIVRVDRAPGVTGPAAVGQALRLHVRWASGGQVRSPESVIRCDGPLASGTTRVATLVYRFDGWPHTAKLVRGARVQIVEQDVAGGPARYRSREEFSGLLTALVPLRRVQDGFERHAQALKLRAESLSAR